MYTWDAWENMFNLSYTKLYKISLCCTNFHIILRAFVPTSICWVHLSRGLSTSSAEASPPTLVDKKNADSKMVPIFFKEVWGGDFLQNEFLSRWDDIYWYMNN